MEDGLQWIGQHAYDKPASDGMRGGISMTAIRGVTVQNLLLGLGAEEEEISRAVPYRDVRPTREAPLLGKN
ncbi:hypothetical protein [Streptomyces olivaceiscleroticus]|uniref:Uncharacterized protein n=1 Tax=Streptomyces olivaceiscleroticus TaxID=68245 RepID=A0ABN0ZKU0_9ACTN